MRIELRRIVRPVSLRDYAEEYGDEVVWIWVNPPKAKRLELEALGTAAGQARDRLIELGEEAGEKDELTEEERQALTEEIEGIGEEFEAIVPQLHQWYAEIWSQHADEGTHWTADDVAEVVAACQDTDPAFWAWLQDESLRLIREHREGVKKKS